MKTKIENLLLQVSSITNGYKKISKVTGENFNIFKILGLSTDEERLHSALISELLNPHGSHELGNIFLLEFIQRINQKCAEKDYQVNLDASDVKSVKAEHFLGCVSETEGGKIDILISDNKGQNIIIENKIYARDQRHQLLRYHKSFPFSPIIYLTLDGNDPSVDSTTSEKFVQEKVLCFSYKSDILKWLEDCKKQTASHPVLRETLAQYINLIKDLTNQSMKNEEKQEVISLILQNQLHMETLQKLSENDLWNEIKNTIVRKLREDIFCNNEITSKLKYGTNENEKSFGLKEFDFWFYKEEWKYCIYFRFERNYEPISYGIDVRVNSGNKREQSEKDKFKNILGISQNDDDWMWKSNLEEYDNKSWYDLNLNGWKLFSDKIDEIINKVGHLMTAG